ncbi:proteoglycan 4 [Carettochelys insculpta]|uniref:proteoglycan 4 n=1 Tax=Carettochelys insculpta TaxID=44489 RepID=UPI003EC13CB0
MQYLKITMVWHIHYIFLVIFSAYLLQQASSQDLSSCAGRCGEGYSREAACHCDYSCLHFMECCHDYKRLCTDELSCKGRCFENFVRGRECDCDAECGKYGKCCPDYQTQCEEALTAQSSPPSKIAPSVTKTTAKKPSKSSTKRKPKKVVQSQEVMEEQDSKHRRTSSRTTTNGEIRGVSEETGSGLENVGTTPDPNTKHLKGKISRQGNEGTTAASLSEQSFSQKLTSQPDKTNMPSRMNTTKILSPKTNMPPTTPTSTAKISALTNAAEATKAKDTSTTSVKHATTDTAKGTITDKKNTTTVRAETTSMKYTAKPANETKAKSATTTLAMEVTTTAKTKMTTAARKATTANSDRPSTTKMAKISGKQVTTAAVMEKSTTDKNYMTTAAKETRTTTEKQGIITADKTIHRKDTTTVAKDTVKTTDERDLTTLDKNMVTTTERKDMTTTDRETINKITATAKRETVTTAKTVTTAASRGIVKTTDKKDTVTVSKKDTTTVDKEIVLTPDEEDLMTKPHATPAGRKTATRAPSTDTPTEIKDPVTTTGKKDTTIVDKENVPTNKRETTTVSDEIRLTPDEEDLMTKPHATPAGRKTATRAPSTDTPTVIEDPVTTTGKKDTTIVDKENVPTNKRETTTVSDEITLTPDEEDLTKQHATTVAKKTVTRAPRQATPAEIKDTTTTAGKKDTTIVDKENVPTNKRETTTVSDEIRLTPDEKDLMTKQHTTTAGKKTVTRTLRTGITTETKDTITTAGKKYTTSMDKENVPTDEREITTVSDEVRLTPDEKLLLTKNHTTTLARKTVTRTPRTDTTAEITDTKITSGKREVTPVDKKHVSTAEREKSTASKKDTTAMDAETVMTTAGRATKDKKDIITSAKSTVTTKTATTGAVSDSGITAVKKDTITVDEEIRLNPYEESLMTKKDTTTAYREIVSLAKTATVAATREIVTRTPRTKTTIATKDAQATKGEEETTTIAEANIMITGEKDTTAKDTTTAFRETLTTKSKTVTTTTAKESVTTTAKMDTTTARKTQTTIKQTPTAAEVTTMAIELTSAGNEENEDNRHNMMATKKTTTEEKKELITAIQGTTTEHSEENALDDKEATTTDKREISESTAIKETLTVSKEVSTVAKSSQERPVSPTQDKAGTSITQIPLIKATAKPFVETEKNAKPVLQITPTAPISLTTSKSTDLTETKVHSETTRETPTVIKISATTSIVNEMNETEDTSANPDTRDTTTQRNRMQSPTENLQTSKIIISPSLTQKPAIDSVTPEQEKNADNASPTAINPTTAPDSNFLRRNTENPKETLASVEGPSQNLTSSKQEDSIEYPAISFTTSVAPLKSTPKSKGKDKNNRLETITKITQTTTKANSANPQKQETMSHGITTNNGADLVSDKEITKKSPIAMNTNASVKHTIGTSTLTAAKDMHKPSTLPNGFITTRPEGKTVTHFSTKTYSMAYSTQAPERSPTIQTDSKLQEKINTTLFYKDEQDDKNLCNGKPADGIVALPNGTLAVFRGHYYWLLDSSRQPTVSPRKITEGWGIPSPIDTVFSRCNCDGKTFFFKDSQYWRFTNDIKDVGYPKEIAKGFAGLNGKIVAVLSVAQHNNRPESVYFFKRGGSVQRYIYNQEPAKTCKKKVYVRYPAYTPRAVIKRRRFDRAIRSAIMYHTPVMSHSIRIHHNPSGILHQEVKINSYWRGFPKVVHLAVSIPNYQRPDGYDYYVFSKDQYYNVDMASRIARSVTAQTGQTVSKDWYKCPQDDL